MEAIKSPCSIYASEAVMCANDGEPSSEFLSHLNECSRCSSYIDAENRSRTELREKVKRSEGNVAFQKINPNRIWWLMLLAITVFVFFGITC